MSHEQYPHTVRGWHSYLGEHGVSDRPYPTDMTDLTPPHDYSDPFEIKPERVALASIFSIRAYQIAKKSLLKQTDVLANPSSRLLLDPSGLEKKSIAIGHKFMESMVEATLEDEQHVLSLSQDDPLRKAFVRLNNIMVPAIKSTFDGGEPEFTVETTGKVIKNPSGVFLEVVGGVGALPYNMELLLAFSAINYYIQFGRFPDTQTILRTMNNSFESVIKLIASNHKGDTLFLGGNDGQIRPDSFELRDETLSFRPEVIDGLQERRRQKKDTRAKTTTCAFLVDTDQVEQFLDEPADFDSPLRDSFDLYMDLLAA